MSVRYRPDLVPHRLVIAPRSEMDFRLRMGGAGYQVPIIPDRTSQYPNYAFIVQAPPWEKFDFLRPDILPPRRS